MGRHPKVLTVILAGGEGSRLEGLTEHRAKPVVPFGGTYRLIDFALSNCAHSGLSDVWIVEQYQPYRLNEHLANGRPWDLDRLHGGLQLLPPYQARHSGKGEGFAEGNADALWRNRTFLRDFHPDLLIVLSADHVYRLDYRDVIESHLSRAQASVTMVTTPIAKKEASRFGNVITNNRGRVTRFAYKPEQPESELGTAEIFVYDAHTLLDSLEHLAQEHAGDEEGPSLKDFGHELIPHLVSEGHAYEYRHTGYWRDVGTIESSFAGHQDLLAPVPPFMLDDPEWPIRTFASPRAPARIAASARIEDSLIAPGCHIAGRVVRSVLGPGVVVEPGATVRDGILMEGVVVRAGATIDRAIIDEQVQVGKKARVGKASDAAEITLVGYRAKIADDARVAAGAHVPPNGEP